MDIVILCLFVFLSMPYAFVMTHLCSSAYFKAKLDYQTSFFRKMNSDKTGDI